MRKKRIGIAIPPKNVALGAVEGNGFMPETVITELLQRLQETDGIEEIVLCRLEDAYVHDGKVYQEENCLSDLDLFFWFYFTAADRRTWGNLMLETLAQKTVVIPNPHGCFTARDKFLAHSRLKNAGLPVADFFLFQAIDVHDIAKLFRNDNRYILKPRFGDFGHGIHMPQTKQGFIDAVQYAQSFYGQDMQVFCERYEENDIRKWISTTVINGELIYGYRKKPETFVDSWKVYDANRQGGNADYADASEVEDMVLEAAKVLECDIIGFDLIFSQKRDSYIIVDENTFPGMYVECFDAAGKGSWAEKISQMIFSHLPR